MMTTKELSQWIDASRVERNPQGDQMGVSNTWVSATHRYLYMATPKVACSKIKMALQKLEGFELPPSPAADPLARHPGPIVRPKHCGFQYARGRRNPDCARLVPLLLRPRSVLAAVVRLGQKVMDLTSPWVGFRESIRESAGYPTPPGGAPGMVGFGDFVRYIGEQDDGDREGHWRSQVGTLYINTIEYDFVGRMEFFARDFTKVLQRFNAPAELIASAPQVVNATQKLPLAMAYDKPLADYVYQVFRDDFEAFEYSRNAWMVE